MDDDFELYDLRVEIVAPQGAKIYCGKPGEWFELRGEQLHMPPGQSFSIYSLAAILPLFQRLRVMVCRPSLSGKSHITAWPPAK